MNQADVWLVEDKPRSYDVGKTTHVTSFGTHHVVYISARATKGLTGELGELGRSTALYFWWQAVPLGPFPCVSKFPGT